MNFVKPTVRIKLVGQPHTGGPDYWEAIARLTTKEGQGVYKSFMGMEKEDALGKAYYFLKMCMKHDTMSLATAERKELDIDKSPEERAYSGRAAQALEDYMQDKITIHEYRDMKKKDFAEIPPPANRDYVLVSAPEPGPKWKWYNWFYNPQD